MSDDAPLEPSSAVRAARAFGRTALLLVPFACGLGLAGAALAAIRHPDHVARLRARLRHGAWPSPAGLVLEVERLAPPLDAALDREPGAEGAGGSHGPWVVVWVVNTGAQALQLWHGDRVGDEVSVEVTPIDGPGEPGDEVPTGFDPVTVGRPLTMSWLAPGGRLGVPLDLGRWLAGRPSGRYRLVVTRMGLGDPRAGPDDPARSAPLTCRVE